MNSSIVATVIANGNKYAIESDAIVNVKLDNSSVIEKLRVTGVSRMGDCLRGVANTGGVIEIPLKKIEDIVDVGNSEFKRVTKTRNR